MLSSTVSIALAATSCAAQSTLLPSNPGGAIPATLQAPSISGFHNATVHPSTGGLAVCVSGQIPVTASAMNLKLNFTVPTNQTQVTEVFLDEFTSGSTFMQQVMAGHMNVSGTYSIGASLCVPANNLKPAGVQFLTHGIGFDRSYWDFAPGYSYVDVAVQNGYAAFFYDRLGVGSSDKANATSVVQSPLEVAIARTLATQLRQGAFSNTTFSKVVGTGHSFGSIITQAITATYPATFDAAILTGFSVNASALPVFMIGNNFAIANYNQPLRFDNLPPGYLVTDDTISNHVGFFRAPNFDPNVLALATATKGTVTWGELFSTGAVGGVATNYTAPVAVVDGANDLPFCFGNCSYPTNLAAAVKPALYPNVPASKFTTYLAPVTGHGLNLHYSAVGAYDYIQSFLKTQGLGL